MLWLELTFSLLFRIHSSHDHELLRNKQVQYLLFVGVKDGTFDTFPRAPYTWDQSHSSTRMLPLSTRETMKKSTLKSQLLVPTSRINIADSTTSTILLIPTSMPSFYEARLNRTTTNVQRIPAGVSSQQFSPASKVSSPLLHHTHAAFSSTGGRYRWN